VLKPIETHYNGYRFRSRLEARWAVFMDVAGVPYEYEKEGFDLGPVGPYLPDFWLPTIECWVEIKGQPATHHEIQKAQALASAGGRPVVLFAGDIDPRLVGGIATDRWYPAAYAWASCSVCGWVDIIDIAAVRSVYCVTCKCSRWFRFTSPLLRSAYDAARGARFEHGEQYKVAS
jgi:hypothetical protein